MEIHITWENGRHETCSWDHFAEANADAYGPSELMVIETMVWAGDEWRGGGGAAPAFTLAAVR
jgi:hypothetical protein